MQGQMGDWGKGRLPSKWYGGAKRCPSHPDPTAHTNPDSRGGQTYKQKVNKTALEENAKGHRDLGVDRFF